MRARHASSPVAALLVGALLAACGSSSPPADAPSDDRTDDGAGPALTFTEQGTEPQPDSGGAGGSGCLPDSPDLPDGIWFGAVTEVRVNSVAFDLRCWFSGEAAARAAAQDGDESPPPNDYHVRDTSTVVRDVLVAPDAVAHVLGPQFEPVARPIDDWPAPGGYLSCPSESCIVWLYVNDGRVTELVEQYTP